MVSVAGTASATGRTVPTVTGPVPADELGATLMHEHVFVLSPELQHNYPEGRAGVGGFDESRRVDEAVARLDAVADRGIDTIVDLTVLGLGRNVARVRRVAERTHCAIVVATGYYTYDRLPFGLRFRGPGTAMGGAEPLTELFVRDLTEGIPGAGGARAGVLKCATDEPGVTPDVERILRAVAVAHRETEAPISTHTDAATRRGLEQLEIFADEGVDLTRVVIGHSGDTTDLDYLEELLASGATVGMDRFGVAEVSFDDRVTTVAELCERGYARQIVLSHDAACYVDWFDWEQVREWAPDWRYTHVPDDVVPALRAQGVTDAQIDAMLVDTPRRILAGG